MTKNKVDKFIRNPKKALFTLAIPIVIAMLVQTLYNVVDTAFVGRLGAESIAALTFAFPLFFILIAMNQGIGAGMNSKIARLMGAKDKKGAENTAMHGLFLGIGAAVAAFILGMIFLEPLFRLIGADGNVLSYSMDYMTIILFGIFMMTPASIFMNIFSAQGDTKTPMKIQVSALVLNMILDPIFIYVLGFGVKGAAIATVIAFTFAFLMGLYFIREKSYLKIHLKSFKFNPKILKEILFIGMPASLVMLLMSLQIMFINKLMAFFGTDYVASFGIASRLHSVAIMPIVAYSIALLTLVGMFYGAKRYDLLRNIILFAVKTATAFAAIIGLIFFIFPEVFLRIFTNDAMLLSTGAAYIRIEVFTFPLIAITMLISRAMQGMGLGLPGLIINIVRVLLVGIPLAYVFVFVLGYSFISVPISMVIGGFFAAGVAIIWICKHFKKLNVLKI